MASISTIVNDFVTKYNALLFGAPCVGSNAEVDRAESIRECIDDINVYLASRNLHFQVDNGILTCYVLPGGVPLHVLRSRGVKTLIRKLDEHGDWQWVNYDGYHDIIH